MRKSRGDKGKKTYCWAAMLWAGMKVELTFQPKHYGLLRSFGLTTKSIGNVVIESPPEVIVYVIVSYLLTLDDPVIDNK